MNIPQRQSAEEKLTRIIEAQIAGGFRGHERLLSVRSSLRVADRLVYFRAEAGNGLVVDHCRSLLDILLDPQGLRATFMSPGGGAEVGGLRDAREAPDRSPVQSDRRRQAARAILDAWIDSDGDAATAVEVAESLIRQGASEAPATTP